MTPLTLTDRTRFQTYLDCPRRRWWAFEWGAQDDRPGGIAPVELSLPLATGIYVHRGVAHLLEQMRGLPADADLSQPIDPGIVEEAVHLACSAYCQEVLARGLAVEAPSDPAFTAQEQEALIEGLVRAYALTQLPDLLQQYEVLEVEQEKQMPLTSGLIWQSRADGLLRRRDDRGLYILSLKTHGGDWGKRQQAQNKHDVQGLSEAAAVEWELTTKKQSLQDDLLRQTQRLVQLFSGSDWGGDVDAAFMEFVKLRVAVENAPTQVDGILMQFLLKGERRQQGADLDGEGNNLGKWEQHSPLVRARRREKTDPISLEPAYEYAWSHYWRCSASHPMRKSKWYPQAQCPGDGRRHKLGDDWEVFHVWEQQDCWRVWTPNGVQVFEPGVRGWIDALHSGYVQPEAGPCLPAQFITPEPYRRQQQDLDQWRDQATYQELDVAGCSKLIREQNPGVRQLLLDQWFGMNRRACDWPTPCPFIPLCHESTLPTAEVDPLALGIYQRRFPHHRPELERCS